MRETPYPVVKWAGGKTRVMGHIVSRLPEKIDRYFEPFLGGGALFLELSRQKRFGRAVVGDENPELMNAYKVIRTSVRDLVAELRNGGYEYDKTRYLEVRALDALSLDPVPRAARFIYLNKTCFNGLYRVNGEGRFNVPFGKYKAPVICDEENLLAVSKAMKKARIVEDDFEHQVQGAKAGDFVYFDPPYLPISDTSSFTSYTKGGFSLGDHVRLSLLFRELAQKGVSVILSNSEHPTVRRLYGDFEMVTITGPRTVGGPAEFRKSVSEVLVMANVPLPSLPAVTSQPSDA